MKWVPRSSRFLRRACPELALSLPKGVGEMVHAAPGLSLPEILWFKDRTAVGKNARTHPQSQDGLEEQQGPALNRIPDANRPLRSTPPVADEDE